MGDDVSLNLESEKGSRSIVESQANLIEIQDSLEKTSEHSQDVRTPMNASLHLETCQQATVTQDLEQGKIKSSEDAITVKQKGEKSKSKFANQAKQQSHSIVVCNLKKYTIFMILFISFTILTGKRNQRNYIMHSCWANSTCIKHRNRKPGSTLY